MKNLLHENFPIYSSSSYAELRNVIGLAIALRTTVLKIHEHCEVTGSEGTSRMNNIEFTRHGIGG